jgi:hypothetical protein
VLVALLLVFAGLAVLDGEWGEAGAFVALAAVVARWPRGPRPRVRLRGPGVRWRS